MVWRLFLLLLLASAWACGITEPKYEKYKNTSSSDLSSADADGEKKVGSDDLTSDDKSSEDKDDEEDDDAPKGCGDATKCFTTLIQPTLENVCSGCHTSGQIGGVALSPGNYTAFREGLLSFSGSDKTKIDSKLRTGPHAGGVQAKPTADDLKQWLDAEAI